MIAWGGHDEASSFVMVEGGLEVPVNRHYCDGAALDPHGYSLPERAV